VNLNILTIFFCCVLATTYIVPFSNQILQTKSVVRLMNVTSTKKLACVNMAALIRKWDMSVTVSVGTNPPKMI